MILCVQGSAQSSVPASGVPSRAAVTVRAIAVEREADGSAIEITSNGALVPTITKLDGPPRIVVDLPGAINTVRQKLGAVADGIRGVRINQFQQNPPITRVVIDLAQPRTYFWEMVQDKLLVHLRAADNSEAAVPQSGSAPAFTQGVEPAASSSNVEGNATVMLAGNRIAPGSSITAGDETAVLNLSRGGQVRVCPGTTVSVTTSQNGRDLMLGMSTGAIETHYRLANSADSIVTPDFRILLAGPGELDYALSADSKGNTCVRSLPGNSAPAVVTELIGNGTYQVQPNDQVVFRSGQLSKIDANVPMDCGCPREQIPVLRAEASSPHPVPHQATDPVNGSPAPESQALSPPPEPGNTIARAEPEPPSPETAPLPALKPNEQRIMVQAPLVFRASDPPPAPIRDARKLPISSRPPLAVQSPALPPVPAVPEPSSAAAKNESKARTQSRGFFGSIKRFFGKIFG